MPPPIRPPTARELAELLPKVAKGWDADPDPSKHETRDAYVFQASDVEGTVPLALRGTFLRNGPGTVDVYGTPLKHPIDGDGIVAALSFEDGRVTYRSRFIQTKTHAEEAEARKMLYDGQMGSRAPAESRRPGWRDPSHTNVMYHGGKIMTMHEYALPHALDPTTLETVGPDALGGALELRTMSAHFRYDADLDSLVTVAFKPGAPAANRAPHLSFYEFAPNWQLKRALRLSVDGLQYAHDFLITKTWYVVHVTPFVDTSPDTLARIAAGKLAPGESMRYVPGAPSQMCLVERFPADAAKPRILRLDTEPCHIYHYANCAEDADGVVKFEACCLPVNFNMEWQHRGFLSNSGDAPGTMFEYEVDPRNGGSLARRVLPGLEATACEFPTTNPFRNCVRAPGVSARFFYLMAGAPGVALPFTDVVKYDTATRRVARWRSDGVVGEPCFVPRLGRASAWHGDEDDGWVIVQLYQHERDRVQFCVLDAKRVAEGPLCRVTLPWKVPYGFHGTFADQVFERPRPKL